VLEEKNKKKSHPVSRLDMPWAYIPLAILQFHASKAKLFPQKMQILSNFLRAQRRALKSPVQEFPLPAASASHIFSLRAFFGKTPPTIVRQEHITTAELPDTISGTFKLLR
jgi:hypothetical protein